MKNAAKMVALACTLGLGGVVATGCGEKVDELGPYVERYRQLDTYHQQLSQMEALIKADEPDKAADTSTIIQAYLDELETFGKTDDKRIQAGHNAVKRALERALNKIVEPDFPTFTVSALKQINLIRNSVTVHFNNLQKRWQEEGRPGEFPLAWAEPE